MKCSTWTRRRCYCFKATFEPTWMNSFWAFSSCVRDYTTEQKQTTMYEDDFKWTKRQVSGIDDPYLMLNKPAAASSTFLWNWNTSQKERRKKLSRTIKAVKLISQAIHRRFVLELQSAFASNIYLRWRNQKSCKKVGTLEYLRYDRKRLTFSGRCSCVLPTVS